MNNAENTVPALSATQIEWLKANDIEVVVSNEPGFKFSFFKDLGYGGHYDELCHAAVSFTRLDGPARFELMVQDREDGWMHERDEKFATVKEALSALLEASKA